MKYLKLLVIALALYTTQAQPTEPILTFNFDPQSKTFNKLLGNNAIKLQFSSSGVFFNSDQSYNVTHGTQITIPETVPGKQTKPKSFLLKSANIEPAILDLPTSNTTYTIDIKKRFGKNNFIITITPTTT